MDEVEEASERSSAADLVEYYRLAYLEILKTRVDGDLGWCLFGR